MAIKIILLTVIFGGSYALLVNQEAYKDTVLKYYDQYDDSVNIAGALTKCAQKDGWLVMPKDSKLNSAVNRLVGNSKVWIGLGDFGVEGAYSFIDGTSLEWANWDSGQPANEGGGNEDCVKMHPNGFWHDYGCEQMSGYVCQIPTSRSLSPYQRHLQLYTGINVTNYKGAVAFCKRLGSRIIHIKDDFNAEKLLTSHPQFGQSAFWISKLGEYEIDSCYISSEDGIEIENCDNERPFVCETVEPHEVKVSEQSPVVPEFSDLEIHCSAYGFPSPNVAWFRNNVEIDNQVKRKSHATLKLPDISSSDAGLYVCRATNVIDHKEYKMEGYALVEVTSYETSERGMEETNSRYGQDDEMY